jgi:hypothetical protein
MMEYFIYEWIRTVLAPSAKPNSTEESLDDTVSC